MYTNSIAPGVFCLGAPDSILAHPYGPGYNSPADPLGLLHSSQWGRGKVGQGLEASPFSLKDTRYISTLHFFLMILFIYFWRVGKVWRKWGRETYMCERHINAWLPLVCPQWGIWPAAQACALGIEPATHSPQVGAQFTEPHLSGLWTSLF